MSWKILDEEIISENPWTSFRRRGFIGPDGKRGDYFFIKTRGGCAMVIAQLPDGRFVMGDNYRFLVDRQSIEFPNGGINKDQTPEEAARAELLEEVGYEAGSMELLHVFEPTNGIAVDPTYVFVARDLKFVGHAREATEDITTKFFTEAEIDQMIRENKITDGQVLASWMVFKSKK